jgi:uncharacterized protein YceK
MGFAGNNWVQSPQLGSLFMRLLAMFLMIVTLSGCSAMLVGGSADSGGQVNCSESDKEAKKRGCE